MDARRLWRRLAGAPPEPAPLEAREAYEQLACAYPPQAHNPLMELEDAAVAELLPDLRGARALDAGCGSGRHLRRLALAGATRLVGCDVAPAMLAQARREASSWPVPALFARADLRALPFRASTFDVVVCGLAVGHVADLARVLGEMARLLAPGGVAVWSDVHPDGTRAGWVRDFRDASGRRVVVRQHLHVFDDHAAGCQAAGLRLDAVREPAIDFEHPRRGRPAVLALRARKPA